jgi:hypothetical protein
VEQGYFEMCLGNLTENLQTSLSYIFLLHKKKANNNATVTAAATRIMCDMFTV